MQADPLRILSTASRPVKKQPVDKTAVPPNLEKLDSLVDSIGDNLGLLTPVASQPPPPSPPKKNRLLRLLGWTGAAAAAVTGAIGGVAYNANKDALSEPSVSIMLDQELFEQQPETVPVRIDQVDQNQSRPQRHQGITVVVPADTLHDFSSRLQQRPEFREFMEREVERLKEKLGEDLAEVKVPSDHLLVDLEAPLPTGDRSFLHLGDFDLPAFGLKSLERQNVPLALAYQVEPFASRLTLDVTPVEMEAPADGPGIFLGGVKATIGTSSDLEVRGTARLGLDLDGAATRPKLEALEARLAREEPGSERHQKLTRLVSQLETRLRHAQEIDGPARELLGDAFEDQQVAFGARVDTPEGPLAEVTYGLWMVPDTSGDGRADLVVRKLLDEDRLDQLQVRLEALHHTGQGDGFLNDQVAGFFESGVRAAVPDAVSQLKNLAEERLEQEILRGGELVEGRANARLQRLYDRWAEEGFGFTPGGLAPITARLGNVELTPDGQLALSLGTLDGAGRTDTRLAPGMQLEEGRFATRLDGGLLNRHLRETLDWDSLLNQVKTSQGLREVRFGRDSQGRTIYPRLVVERGRPCVVFDIVVKMDGAKPVEGATGLLKGATGALDGGAEKLQDGLKKEAGAVGEVVGGILRAPTFLLDTIIGGGKAVVDHTVGAVVDGGTDVLTRPTVHTKVSIPLEFQARGGGITVVPDGEGVRFSEAETKLPFDILDLVPTRLLSNLVVNLVAEAEGPEKIGEKAEQHAVGVNLERFGAEFRETHVVGREGQVPDLVFELKASDGAVDFAARQLLSPGSGARSGPAR